MPVRMPQQLPAAVHLRLGQLAVDARRPRDASRISSGINGADFCPWSWVLHPGSGSWVLGPWFLGPGSWVLGSFVHRDFIGSSNF